MARDNNTRVSEGKSAQNVQDNTIMAGKKGAEVVVNTVVAALKKNDIKIKK
jgi:hypothetical protein